MMNFMNPKKVFFSIFCLINVLSCSNNPAIRNIRDTIGYIPPLIKSYVKSKKFYTNDGKYFIRYNYFTGINYYWAKKIHLEQNDLFSIYDLKNERYSRIDISKIGLKKRELYDRINSKIIACNSAAPAIAIGRLYDWNNNFIIKNALKLRTAYRYGNQDFNRLTIEELQFISSYIKEVTGPADRIHNQKIIALCKRKNYLPVGNLSYEFALKNKFPLFNSNTKYYLTSNANLEQQISKHHDSYEYNCEIIKLHVDTIRKLFKNYISIEEKHYSSIEQLKMILNKHFTEKSAVVLYFGEHILNIVGYYLDDSMKKFEIYGTETLHETRYGAYYKINIGSPGFDIKNGAYCYILKKIN